MELLRSISFSKNRALEVKIVLFGFVLSMIVIASRAGLIGSKYSYLGLVCVPLIVVLHEALHGFLFWLFSGKVKFGAKVMRTLGPTFYATSPGNYFTRAKFILICLAPQLLTPFFLFLTLPLFTEWLRVFFYWSAVLNLGGACADLYVVFVLLRIGRVKVEDYIEGIRIYKE